MATNLGTWFGATISTVISPLRDIFFKHASYCLNTGNNVRAHEDSANDLREKKAAVEEEIRVGIHNGFIMTESAGLWLNRATEALSKEERNRGQYDRRRRFLCGCSLNCRANYNIGKRAAKEIREVKACAATVPAVHINATVSAPPPSVVNIPIQSAQLPSQDSILLKVCQSIKDDPDGMIGIWGPDGVGNTHLLKKINNWFTGDSSYFVIFATASRECSVQHIQSQIIQRLEIRKDNDVGTPATNISIQLRARNFLLLVDDVYEKLDLLAVGIPYPLGTAGDYKRKVVITSRSETVCVQMDVNTYIEVPGLGEIEALRLFAQNVGQEDIDSDPQIGALAKDLVAELKGVPSELIHFGKEMVGKTDPREWEDVIQAVRRSNFQKKDPTLAGRTLRNLEDATSNLLAKRNDVRCRIEVAERQNMTSTNEADRWLKIVDTISSAVQIIIDSNKLNKDVTLEAIEKLPEVQACLRACPNNDNIALVSVPPLAQEIPGPSMSAENPNLQRALQLIEHGAVGMIGICGQGGVGKTYLLKGINNSVAVAGGMSFNIVIFVTASRGCSVEKMQRDFLRKLGMKEDGNAESQRDQIFNFLQNRSFLVLLDDLWEQIDLRAVGVPDPLETVNQHKRKVVLTTRLISVCGEMDVREEINVACLQEDEAWQLFQEKVGQRTLSSHPRIEPLARELVKELKGLPLALEVIGRAMYGKDVKGWESAIKHMQQSRFEDMNIVFKQLKFSYDCLGNNTLKDCFLTCALWQEDWNIRKVDLARCWMGLGLLDEAEDADIESSYSKAYSLIGDLRDASLIQSQGNWDGYVRMHDVIRDLALWISCGCGEDNYKWFVRAGVGQHESLSIPWSKAECISLNENYIHIFPPFDLNPCPMKTRILCLRNNAISVSIAPAIKNFTSLTYLDLSNNDLVNIPDDLCSLVNLVHLDLSYNRLTQQVHHYFTDLIKLKFLYLLKSGIVIIPDKVILNLKALQLVDLRTSLGFSGLARGSTPNFHAAVFGELGTLPHLKAASIEIDGYSKYDLLSVVASFPIRSLLLRNLKGRPALRLYDISSLGFVNETLYELDIRQSDMEQLELGQADYRFSILNRFTLFNLPMLKEITWSGSSLASVFPRLTILRLYHCSWLEHLSWVIDFPCLEQLDINFCISMKQAFLKPITHGTFPCLKYLRLQLNSNLVTICDPDVVFPSLEKLIIYECQDLKRLPFEMHSLPPKLQELRFNDVKYWEKLEWGEGVKFFLQPSLVIGYES